MIAYDVYYTDGSMDADVPLPEPPSLEAARKNPAKKARREYLLRILRGAYARETNGDGTTLRWMGAARGWE